MPCEYRKGSYLISTDPARLDIDVIHSYLARSYWKPGVPRDQVARSIEHSLCFGLFDGQAQIGFARVVTDTTDFAYLCDVFVLETYQGLGLGAWLIQCVTEHPTLCGLRTFVLGTRDAHGLYRKFGFQALPDPKRFMVKTVVQPWYDPHLAERPPDR